MKVEKVRTASSIDINREFTVSSHPAQHLGQNRSTHLFPTQLIDQIDQLWRLPSKINIALLKLKR